MVAVLVQCNVAGAFAWLAMRLTEKEIRYVLDLIAKTIPSGMGYSSDPFVGALQVKLSVMLQLSTGSREAK